MVPPRAKFPISWSHRVPMFPMSRCHHVPLSPIACAPCCAQSFPSHGVPPVCQGRLSHDTFACKVAHIKDLACVNFSHVKVPSCAEVAQVNAPSCPYVALRMVPHVPTLPIAWCLRAPMLPTVCQGGLLHDSPMHPCWPILVVHIASTHIAQRLCPSCAKLPMCPECAHRVPKFP